MPKTATFVSYFSAFIAGLFLFIAGEENLLLLYLLICLLLISYNMNRRVDFNRKMLRLVLTSSDAKLLAIAEKLGVSKGDMKKQVAKMKQFTDENTWQQFKKEVQDVTGRPLIDDIE